MLRHFNFSQEDSDVVSTQADSDTNTAKTIREKEYTYYVRISNFKQLENASHAEKHEQWQCLIPRNDLNAGEAHLRARKITSSTGEVKFELTLKSKTKDDNTKFESTLNASEQIFTQIAFIADYGMRKDRYTFPIEGSNLKWEVDVYPDGKAGYYTWAKIDLEIKEDIDKVPELPIEVEEVITPNDALTPEGKARVDKLFDTYFLMQNKYRPLDKLESKPSEDEVNDTLSQDDSTDASAQDDTNSEDTGSDDSSQDNQNASPDESVPEENNNSGNEDESNSSDTEEKDSDDTYPKDENGEVDKA